MTVEKLNDSDRRTIEMATRVVPRPVPERILDIHREGIARARRKLAACEAEARMHERTIAMRTLALELLGVGEEKT
jgi:hypothetical protein